MKCKKSIMGLAALLIVIFHFYIPFTGTQVEMILYRAAFVGVDMFFFVSAYSLAQRDKIAYWPFLKNRLLSTYLPFVLFAVVANFYEKWKMPNPLAVFQGTEKLPRLFLVITGAEFFQRGGGSFLWFFVAIMLVYLIAPFLVRLKKRFGWKAFLGMILVWAILSVLLQYVFHYTKVFILVNRLPIFFVGLYYEELRKLPLKAAKLPVILVGLAAGCALIWKFGYPVMLNKPFADMYYIIAIPFVLSFIALWDFLSTRIPFKNVPFQFVGQLTLELYGLQMIFGFVIESKLLKALSKSALPLPVSKLMTFLITTLCLILAAWIIHFVKNLITKLIKKNKKQK